jgi:hypothetical protein
MITQILQPEFSAAISGIKTPEDALGSAQRQVEHILGIEEQNRLTTKSTKRRKADSGVIPNL